ncbi:hypothetical protein Bca52824_094509 [Brassica carinata]|uniref:Uncharacterized protein n=1 Tax=Brassica carinata TaxID=52824 RepID=A0A8X7P3N2_BRACI|nr:hypothetical protein Bca52824_094509 [Brassica carinata]
MPRTCQDRDLLLHGAESTRGLLLGIGIAGEAEETGAVLHTRLIPIAGRGSWIHALAIMLKAQISSRSMGGEVSRRRSRSISPRRHRSRSVTPKRRSPTPKRYKRQKSRSSSPSPARRSPATTLESAKNRNGEKLIKEEEERKSFKSAAGFMAFSHRLHLKGDKL